MQLVDNIYMVLTQAAISAPASSSAQHVVQSPALPQSQQSQQSQQQLLHFRRATWLTARALLSAIGNFSSDTFDELRVFCETHRLSIDNFYRYTVPSELSYNITSNTFVLTLFG